jgi:hypothetical protein
MARGRRLTPRRRNGRTLFAGLVPSPGFVKKGQRNTPQEKSPFESPWEQVTRDDSFPAESLLRGLTNSRTPDFPPDLSCFFLLSPRFCPMRILRFKRGPFVVNSGPWVLGLVVAVPLDFSSLSSPVLFMLLQTTTQAFFRPTTATRPSRFTVAHFAESKPSQPSLLFLLHAG